MATATKLERRKLTFATLDDVVKDAENLQAKGYEKTGNWDLGQVCLHLADWMSFPMDGFPKPPLPIRMMLWAMRVTIGKKMFRQNLSEGMPAGKPTMPQTVHQGGSDAVAAIASLKETVERFKTFGGTLHPSPLFGALSKDDAEKLQLVHCALHLSFLVPKA
jgi:hypothetical protein